MVAATPIKQAVPARRAAARMSGFTSNYLCIKESKETSACVANAGVT